MSLDRLPVSLAALLCATVAYFWSHLPEPPATAEALPAFAAEFAGFARRERILAFPLGVATSIATLIVLFRHGALVSRRGGLQGAAAAVLFASGLLNTLVEEPLVKEIVRQTGDGAVDGLAPPSSSRRVFAAPPSRGSPTRAWSGPSPAWRRSAC